MLPAGCAEDIAMVEACCTSLWDVADSLLSEVLDIVNECIGDDCAPLVGFVSVAEPSYGENGNYVSTWLIAVDPAGSTSSKFPQRPRATFGVKIMESGWPVISLDSGSLALPDAESMHELSKHSMSHAERALRHVYGLVNQGQLGNGCSYQAAGALRPTARTSGLVGWIFDVTIEFSFQPIAAAS